MIKFRFSKKATKFDKNFPYLTLLIDFKKIGTFFQNVAFLEYLHFNIALFYDKAIETYFVCGHFGFNIVTNSAAALCMKSGMIHP